MVIEISLRKAVEEIKRGYEEGLINKVLITPGENGDLVKLTSELGKEAIPYEILKKPASTSRNYDFNLIDSVFI